MTTGPLTTTGIYDTIWSESDYTINWAGQPDLTAPFVWWEKSTVQEGDSTYIRWEIRNDGDGSAEPSHAKAWLSIDNDFDTSDDYYLGEISVNALLPSESDYPQWDFNMPDLGSGSYSVWMLCEVDSQDQVDESNEDNPYKSNNDVFFTATDALGEIHGSKWNDLNGNGIWDDGEPSLAGWTIYLDIDGDGVWDDSTVTGPD